MRLGRRRDHDTNDRGVRKDRLDGVVDVHIRCDLGGFGSPGRGWVNYSSQAAERIGGADDICPPRSTSKHRDLRI